MKIFSSHILCPSILSSFDPDRSDLHIFLGAVKKDEDIQFSHIMP
jgi:hypothetical protein